MVWSILFWLSDSSRLLLVFIDRPVEKLLCLCSDEEPRTLPLPVHTLALGHTPLRPQAINADLKEKEWLFFFMKESCSDWLPVQNEGRAPGLFYCSHFPLFQLMLKAHLGRRPEILLHVLQQLGQTAPSSPFLTPGCDMPFPLAFFWLSKTLPIQ